MDFIITKSSTIPEGATLEDCIAYNRLDHDGYRWYNTWFKKKGTKSQDVALELDRISDFFREQLLPDGITSILQLAENGLLERLSSDEYNAYVEGEYTTVWARMIAREKDYNLYLAFYEKEGGKNE